MAGIPDMCSRWWNVKSEFRAGTCGLAAQRLPAHFACAACPTLCALPSLPSHAAAVLVHLPVCAAPQPRSRHRHHGGDDADAAGAPPHREVQRGRGGQRTWEGGMAWVGGQREAAVAGPDLPLVAAAARLAVPRLLCDAPPRRAACMPSSPACPPPPPPTPTPTPPHPTPPAPHRTPPTHWRPPIPPCLRGSRWPRL